MKKIIIAVDGYSSCGKSTLAKGLAKRLFYSFIDTGAMYRAVTLYFLDHQLNWEDSEAVEQALQQISVRFRFDPATQQNRTLLNGVDVEEEIRGLRVSNQVSPVSAISAVRRFLVAQQQAMGASKGVVMDGRDIGTVVFPDAEIKLFITADPEVRAQRRYRELKEKGQEVPIELVRKNLAERDLIDTTRADSPLKKASDAIVIDNSDLTREAQLEVALNIVQQRLSA